MRSFLHLFVILLSLLALIIQACDSDTVDTSGLQGKAGSLARFAMGPNHLYAVDDRAINVFEIQQGGGLLEVKTVEAGIDIQTIFATETHLFLGSGDAMYIYDINDPASPVFLSRYDHVVSCDPVVVNGQYAYVSLRVRESCRVSGTDALEIIDISNLEAPRLVQTYPMSSPYGLGVDGQLLFVCEGTNGLKIFGAGNPLSIELIKLYTGIHAYDIIPYNGVAVLTGNDGIFQFDYSDPKAIRQISHIPVQP